MGRRGNGTGEGHRAHVDLCSVNPGTRDRVAYLGTRRLGWTPAVPGAVQPGGQADRETGIDTTGIVCWAVWWVPNPAWRVREGFLVEVRAPLSLSPSPSLPYDMC